MIRYLLPKKSYKSFLTRLLAFTFTFLAFVADAQEVVFGKVITGNFSGQVSVSTVENNVQGMTFNSNGTKLFIVGQTNKAVREYTLSTAYDLSTASFSATSLSVASQLSANVTGMGFSDSGSKLYVCGRNYNLFSEINESTVVEYTLSTAYDITSVSSTESFVVHSDESFIEGLTFNSDGTTLFIIGSGSGEIHEYVLATGFDLSSVNPSVVSIAPGTDSNYTGISFNSAGDRMYLIGSGDNRVDEFYLGTPFDLSGNTYFLDDYNPVLTPLALAFDTNENTLYVAGFSGINSVVNSYALNDTNVFTENTANNGSVGGLATLYAVGGDFNNIGGALTSGDFTISNLPAGLSATINILSANEASIGFTGTATYHQAYNDVENLNMSFSASAFDGGASGTSSEATGFSLEFTDNPVISYRLALGQSSSTSLANMGFSFPYGLWIDNTSERIFYSGVVGSGTEFIYQEDMAAANDLSALTPAGSFQVPTTINELAFNEAGDKMWLSAFFPSAPNKIYQYSLSSSFDITSAIADGVTNTFSQQTDFFFNSDGSQVIVHDFQNGSKLAAYSLSTNFDMVNSTLTKTSELDIENASGVVLDETGKLLFTSFNSSTLGTFFVKMYILDVAFDLSSAVLEGTTGIGSGVTDLFYRDGYLYILKNTKEILIMSIGDQGVFEEVAANDGSVIGEMVITLTGDTFVNPSGSLSTGVDYSIDNLPSGLSSSIVVDADGKIATLTLTGNAINSNKINDVSSLEITFNSSAFMNSASSAVFNATSASTGASITFTDSKSNVFQLKPQSVFANENSNSGGLTDLDADGDLDLVLLRSQLSAGYYLNDGTGLFSVYTQLSSSSNFGLNSLAITDYNNDQVDDIIFGNTGDDRIWVNNGGLNFTGALISNSNVQLTHHISSEDLDGDGDGDLILSQGDKLLIYEVENGSSSVLQPGDYIVNGNVSGFVDAIDIRGTQVVDIDGDGDLDILVAKLSGSRNVVLECVNSTNLTYNAYYVTDLSDDSRRFAAADFDQDGNMDFVTAYLGTGTGVLNKISYGKGGSVASYLNTSTSSVATMFEEVDLSSNIGNTRDVDTLDFNNDGLIDLLVANEGGSAFLFENEGNRIFSLTQIIQTGLTSGLKESVVGDLNGDQLVDIVFVGVGIETVYLNSEITGTYWTGSDNVIWDWAANWSSNTVPTASDNVVVTSQLNQPTLPLNDDMAINNLVLADNANVTVTSGGSLAIYGSVTGDGDITAKRYLAGSNAYNVLGSPIKDKSFADINPDFTYEWNGTSYSEPSGMITPGKGYFIAYSNAVKEFELMGKPNTGQINVPVSTAGDAFNLLANPYLAAINRSAFISANSSLIDGNIWFWNDGYSNVGANRGGDYILINNLGVASTIDLGDGVSGSKSLPSTNTPITSFQGFLVSATANANVTFEPTMQTSAAGSNGDGNFYRKTSDEKTTVKLSLSNADNYNETLIGLVEGATLGHDYALDGAYRSVNPDFAFYSKMGEQKMAIQALPTNQELPELPLGIELRTAGNYRLQVEEMVNLKGVGVSLKNNLTGEVIALSDHSELALALTAGKNNQYSLVFEPTEVLGIESIAGLRVSGSTERLIVKTDITGTHRARIFDLSGRNYYDETVTFADGTAELLTSLRAQRVYIIKVQDQSLKFIIK